jgi:hypothetical protein
VISSTYLKYFLNFEGGVAMNEIIAIICEYNPFHNGHIHHIKEIKKKYPESIIILVLNGYFLERGEISTISKYDKGGISYPFISSKFI